MDSKGEDIREVYFGHEHVTAIEPTRGWRMLDWRELWAYRELLWVLTTRDIKVRDKQTVLRRPRHVNGRIAVKRER